jgi:hypothetical protein
MVKNYLEWLCNYHLFIMYQQQHFSKLQLTHSLSDLLRVHSSGEQLQSAHFIFLSVRLKSFHNKLIHQCYWINTSYISELIHIGYVKI